MRLTLRCKDIQFPADEDIATWLQSGLFESRPDASTPGQHSSAQDQTEKPGVRREGDSAQNPPQSTGGKDNPASTAWIL